MNSHIELNSPSLDCFDIVESCEMLAAVLLESDDENERKAAQKCLTICLESLESSLTQPLSTARIAQLTADSVPDVLHPYFYQDSEMLRQYCQALNRAMTNNTLAPADNASLAGLLFDLTGYMADDLRAPRFARGQSIH